MEEKIKTTNIKEMLEDKKKQLISNSTDKEQAKLLISELLQLHAQDCIEPCEIIVPTSSVLEEVSLDASNYKLCKTGILFHAKSGMTIFVEPRCVSLYTMLQEALDFKRHENDKEEQQDEETHKMKSMFFDAVTNAMTLPIGCSINTGILFDTVIKFLDSFTTYTKEMLDNQPLHEETTEDLIANYKAEQHAEALDNVSEILKQGEE